MCYKYYFLNLLIVDARHSSYFLTKNNAILAGNFSNGKARLMKLSFRWKGAYRGHPIRANRISRVSIISLNISISVWYADEINNVVWRCWPFLRRQRFFICHYRWLISDCRVCAQRVSLYAAFYRKKTGRLLRSLLRSGTAKRDIYGAASHIIWYEHLEK